MTGPPEEHSTFRDGEGPQSTSTGIRYFHVGAGFNIPQMSEELSGYVQVLLGREDPPIDTGITTMMEVAEAYHARAKEMEMELLEAEAEGAVTRGSRGYKFRTGKLRKFIELAEKTIDMGSRRVTVAQYMFREREGR